MGQNTTCVNTRVIVVVLRSCYVVHKSNTATNSNLIMRIMGHLFPRCRPRSDAAVCLASFDGKNASFQFVAHGKDMTKIEL